MNEGARKIASMQPSMSLRALAGLWAQELRLDPELFLYQLVGAALEGAFDNIEMDGKAGLGLLSVEEGGGRSWTVRGLDLRKEAAALAEQTGANIFVVMGPAVNADCVALKKEAAWHFAEMHNFNPPSFWPKPRGPRPSARLSGNALDQLVAFLNGGKRMIEGEARQAALDHFGADKVPDQLWRKARAKMDSTKKMKRGEKRQ